MNFVLNKKNWTSKSPNADTVPLEINWKMNVECKDRSLPTYVKDNIFTDYLDPLGPLV